MSRLRRRRFPRHFTGHCSSSSSSSSGCGRKLRLLGGHLRHTGSSGGGAGASLPHLGRGCGHARPGRHVCGECRRRRRPEQRVVLADERFFLSWKWSKCLGLQVCAATPAAAATTAAAGGTGQLLVVPLPLAVQLGELQTPATCRSTE